jgi:hypothetical protein
MDNLLLHLRRSILAIAFVVFLNLGTQLCHAQYSPSHPTVVAMVDRGIAYLEKNEAVDGDFNEGGAILVGYTINKVKADPDHPIVKQSIARAVHLARSLGTGSRHDHKVTYNVAVACLLLCDTDPEKYRPEIEMIRDWYVAVQKPHGGFTYLEAQAGDTSQTQYAVLALWSMNEIGVAPPIETIEAALNWLMRYQNNDGTWSYQPSDQMRGPGTKSLATAGLGALLIGGDILKLYGTRGKKQIDDGIPAALRLVVEQPERKGGAGGGVLTKADLNPTIERGTNWQAANAGTPPMNTRDWYTYWRYSQERYESFLEIVRNKQEKSPAWYNQGVEQLRQLQDDKGAWGNKHADHCPPPVATAFCILYLIRSTQKAIGSLNEGLLAGGYGLPDDVSAMRQVGDKVVGSTSASSIDDLLTMMEEDDPKASSEENLLDNLRLSPKPETRRAQLSRLSRILESNILNDKDYARRRVAARLLSQADDLDFVPAMIYALTDPDLQTSKFAEDGLRLVSRRFDLVAPEGPTKEATIAARRAAAENWKKWYQSLRPDYIFEAP